MKKFCMPFLICGLSLFAQSEESSIAEVLCHLRVGDHDAALQRCQFAIKVHPLSQPLARHLLKLYAKAGQFEEALALFKQIKEGSPVHGEHDFELLEELAWSALSSTPISLQARLHRLAAAVQTHDARAADWVVEELSSQMAPLRAFAAQQALYFPDEKIKAAIRLRLLAEKDQGVLLRLIRTTAQHKMVEMAPFLKEMAEDGSLGEEEKIMAALVWAFLSSLDNPSIPMEIIKSPLPQMRLAGLGALVEERREEELLSCTELMDDSYLKVRLAYLRSLWQTERVICDDATLKEGFFKLVQSGHPELGLHGSLLLWPYQQEDIASFLDHLLDHSSSKWRFAAVSLLPYFEIAALEKKVINSDDLLLKMNYLISQSYFRTLNEAEKDMIREGICSYHDLLMVDTVSCSPFDLLFSSTLKQHPYISGYPQIMDQMARLYVFNRLFILGDLKAKEALAQFLKKTSSFGSRAAAFFLWKEGEVEGLEILKSTFEESDPEEYDHTAVEAALFLVMSIKDLKAANYLMEHYHHLLWETKATVCEVLGHLGGEEVVCFLFERLCEPGQLLRQKAASSLLMALYH